jgi:hypothetical protein
MEMQKHIYRALNVWSHSEMKAILTLIYYPRVSYEKLKPGVTFTIREGPKIVGFGSGLRLLNL